MLSYYRSLELLVRRSLGLNLVVISPRHFSSVTTAFENSQQSTVYILYCTGFARFFNRLFTCRPLLLDCVANYITLHTIFKSGGGLSKNNC